MIARLHIKYHLPESWNISQEMIGSVQQSVLAGYDPTVKTENDMSDINQVPLHADAQGHPQHPPVINIDPLEGELENLNKLEETARNTMCGHSNGEVLFWWKRGTGSQVFVKYGTGENVMFRIRAGYGRSDVAGILGVGWKVEDDDDFEGEPLDSLWPEGGDEVA